MRNEAYIQELKSMIERDASPKSHTFGKQAVYYIFFTVFATLFTYFLITIW